MERYLALDIIRPGDIVLSAGLTKTSVGIRIATFSRVSHAALALHPLIWFEALRDIGVAYKVVVPTLTWDGQNIRLGMEVPRGETYIIKRMKTDPYDADDPVARHAFARSLIKATSRYTFLNYATPEQFLPILKFKLGNTGLARFIANNLNRSGTKLYPGPFCSWLVADCYAEAGLTLFDNGGPPPSDIEPRRITPRAIDKSEKLHEIKCVINAVPLEVMPHLKQVDVQLRLAAVLGAANLSSVSEGAALPKLVGEINRHMMSLGKLGANLFDFKALEESANALSRIDEKGERDFKDWQNSAQQAFDIFYPHLVERSERMDLLTPCRNECLDESSGSLSCSGWPRCRRHWKQTQGTRQALYKVFPRPTASA